MPHMDVGGAYGGWWASDGVCVTTINHVHAHLVDGVRTLCTVLSDLGGGVNGHDVNLWCVTM